MAAKILFQPFPIKNYNTVAGKMQKKSNSVVKGAKNRLNIPESGIGKAGTSKNDVLHLTGTDKLISCSKKTASGSFHY
jgi:hypothetical protein